MKLYPYAYLTDTHHYEGRMMLQPLVPPLMGRHHYAGKVDEVIVRNKATDAEVEVSDAIVGEVYAADEQECYERTGAEADAWCAADAVRRGGRGEPVGG